MVSTRTVPGMLEEAIRHLLQCEADVLEADLLADDIERHVAEAVVHRPHDAGQHRAVADAGVEHPHRGRPRVEVRELFGNAVRDFPLLAAGIDEQQIFLPVVEEAEIALRVVRCRPRRSWRRRDGSWRRRWLRPHGNVRCRRTCSDHATWRMSGHEAMDAVECVCGDAAAVAQPGGELAVIHGPASECGFGEACLPAIVGDLLE